MRTPKKTGNRITQYDLGYKDGLAGHPLPDLAAGDTEYCRGWEDGRKARGTER
jgi:hypothetical protein